MFRWYRNWKARKYHDQVTNDYRTFAATLGNGISYAYMGEPNIIFNGKRHNLKESFEVLDELEEQYASLGYRIVDLDRWVDYGGYGASVDDVWLVKREDGERPKFTKDTHIEDTIEVGEIAKIVMETGKPVIGEYGPDGKFHPRSPEDYSETQERGVS